MKYADEQLKQALAKMLPEVLIWDDGENSVGCPLLWDEGNPVLDTELLHLCWLVEKELCYPEYSMFSDTSFDLEHDKHKSGKQWGWLSMDWQQRVIALAKVKGIDL